MVRVLKSMVWLVLVVCIGAPIGVSRTLALPVPPPALPGPAAVPTFMTSFTLPDSDDTKYPDMAVFGSAVHMVGSPKTQVSYWTKQDSSASSSAREVLATSSTGGSLPDYATAAVATGADGAVYVAWISQGVGIFMRKKPLGGSWGATQTVLTSSVFRAYIDVGVTTTGDIFVSWNQDSLFRYTRSTDGGATWSTPEAVSSKTALNRPSIATGPGGSIFIAHGSEDGHIYAALWQNNGFVTADVTPSPSGFNADPTGTIGADGRLYVAWRVVAGGIYYAQQQSNGSWLVSHLADGESYGVVKVHADAQNNLHVFWPGNISGGWDMWYALKPASGAWQGPVSAAGNANIIADVAGAGTVSDKAYGHAVVERFTGSGMAIRYYLFAGAQAPSAQPVIEGSALYTNKGSLSVGFSNVLGAPGSLRWRWNAVPTDQASDSGGWVTFTNPHAVAPPSMGVNVCQPLTLYTQVRNADFLTPVGTGQDSITFDNGVQAIVAALNPHMTPGSGDTLAQGGASNGDARYTRDRLFTLDIANSGECAGLKSFSVTGSVGTTPLAASGYHGTLVLPGDLSPGAKPVSVIVTDAITNTMTAPKTMVYDPADTDPDPLVNNTDGLPVLSAGATLTVTGSTDRVMRRLSFANVSVSDNYYGQQGENLPAGRQFWGVWVANSRTNVSPDDASLRWVAVRVLNPQAAFTLDWSLFSGLNYGPSTNRGGTYYVYAKVLDGAGNPSVQTITTTTTLDSSYAVPLQGLPLLKR